MANVVDGGAVSQLQIDDDVILVEQKKDLVYVCCFYAVIDADADFIYNLLVFLLFA